MPTFRLVTASANYGSRKIKSKRGNGGTQALGEETAKIWCRGPERHVAGHDSVLCQAGSIAADVLGQAGLNQSIPKPLPWFCSQPFRYSLARAV
jgi:hypothetical protein